MNIKYPLILDVINGTLHDLGLPELRCKKTNTNGGEWYGMCPRCYQEYGDGGKDRFLVWPNSNERPIEGFSGSKPVFMCRRCKRENGSDWSGDLVQYCQDVMGIGYVETRKFLKLPPKGEIFYTSLAPSRDRQKPLFPPGDEWQSLIWEFIVQWERALWMPENRGVLEYLFDRGFTEQTIKRGRWGYTGDNDEYWQGSEFGLEGSVRISSGIVIPEFHRNPVTGEQEVWGVAIRRDDEIVEEECKRTGKREKYHFIRGSVRGLFLDETLDPDKPLFMVEGQFDATSIQQEAEDLVSVIATQGKKGARHLYHVNLINMMSDYVILVRDNDEEGEILKDDITGYWMEELDNAFVEFPPAHDVGEMLQKPGEVRKWVEGILLRYSKLGLGSKFEGVNGQSGVRDLPTIKTPQISILDPVMDIQKNDESDQINDDIIIDEVNVLGSKSEGVNKQNDMDVPEESEIAQISILDPVMGVCRACSHSAKFADCMGNRWCGIHYAAVILMDLGEKLAWTELYVPEGEGLLCDGTWLSSAPCHVNPGFSGYLTFCEVAASETIWVAARYARDVKFDYIKDNSLQNAFRMPIIHPCVNCGKDADKAVFLYPEPPKRWEGQDIKVAYKDEKQTGFITWQGTEDEMRWCARCIAAHNFLMEMERHGFPGFEYGIHHIQPGKQATINFVLNKDVDDAFRRMIHINFTLDSFRYYRKWVIK